MVDATADGEIVTARIVRETAAAKRERTAAQMAAPQREEIVYMKTPGLAVESVPPPPPAVDGDAAYRHLRLSICAVLVLVLFLVWLRQRMGSVKR